MMELVATHMAHQTDYVTFALDEYRDAEGHQMLLAHLHVHKWTPQYLKRIRRDWAVFRNAVTMPLFATPKDYDAKWDRFVTLMGWKPYSSVLCHDGIERPLYIHTVD
jgi:hypothetical protein